jgi:hypothetical protein
MSRLELFHAVEEKSSVCRIGTRMRALRYWPCCRLCFGVLLALWASSLFSPRARAGCNEHVVVTWPTAGMSYRGEVDLSSRLLPNPSPHHSLPGPRPCSGPHCSRAPLAPLAPPATTIAPSQEWACLALISSGADGQGRAHHLEDGPHKPIFRKLRIYHPPR